MEPEGESGFGGTVYVMTSTVGEDAPAEGEPLPPEPGTVAVLGCEESLEPEPGRVIVSGCGDALPAPEPEAVAEGGCG